jgi:hypothetical protein
MKIVSLKFKWSFFALILFWIGLGSLAFHASRYVSAKDISQDPSNDPPAQASDCLSGGGWTWSSGPVRPDLASQVQGVLQAQAMEVYVSAREYGEIDGCGNFHLSSMDFDLDFPNSQSADAAIQQVQTIQDTLVATDIPRLGNVRFTVAGELLTNPVITQQFAVELPAGMVPANIIAQTTPMSQSKALVIIFNPYMTNGQRLVDRYGYTSPSLITSQLQDFFANASGGKIQYLVANTYELNEFTLFQDGYRYTAAEYEAMRDGQIQGHSGQFDYNQIVNDARFDICGKANRGEINEVWLFGMPYSAGMWESTLVGPNAYFYNDGQSVPGPWTCDHLVPIMGFNYERTVYEATEDFGHRTESTLSHVYGWHPINKVTNNWDMFSEMANQYPSFSYSGCGNVHYPPNGESDYNWRNTISIQTLCDDFYNYPNLSPAGSVLTTVNCHTWGCDQLQYFNYWFSHFPNKPGCGTDGISSDWWWYFIDPDLANSPADACSLLDPARPAPVLFNKLGPVKGYTQKKLQVTLSWKSSANAASYEVCYADTAGGTCYGGWHNVGSSLSATYTGLANNWTYYWQVRARNSQDVTDANDGWWSFRVQNQLPASFNKTSPDTGSVQQTYQVLLTWESSANANSYEYCYETSTNHLCNGGWTSAGNQTSAIIPYGLDYDSTYYWQVRAVNETGSVEAADGWRSFHTLLAPQADFLKLTPDNGANKMYDNFLLTWSSAAGATSYEYCISNTDDYFCRDGWTNTGMSTMAQVTGLHFNSNYFWQVRAITPDGIVEADDYWFRFHVRLAPPAAFKKLSPANGASDQPLTVTANWENNGRVQFYEICIDTTNDNQCSGNWNYNGDNTQVSFNNLAYSTTYYWQVRVRFGEPEDVIEADDGAWGSFTTISPPGCPLITGWRGEYWGNQTLSGSRTLCRDDQTLNFDWAYSAPDPSLPQGSFSVRWTRTLDFSNKPYWFYLRHDDGARLYIDGALKLDAWSTCCRVDAVQLSLSPGSHEVSVEMYQSGGASNVAFWYEPVAVDGWRAEFYNNTTVDGYPVLIRDDPALDFEWYSGSPDPLVRSDQFSARWTREFPFVAGTYTFHIFHDDGARLFIDDVNVFENWCDNCRQTDEVVQQLTAGPHTIRLEMFENQGWSGVKLTWEPADFTKNGPPDGGSDVLRNPTLSWNSSSGASSYEICYDMIAGADCDTTWTVVGEGTNAALSGLNPNTTYYWQVRASNPGGMTYADSNTWWSFTTGKYFKIYLPVVKK